MTAPPHIRDATEADLEGVRSCLVETWHATYDVIYGAAEVTAITDKWHALPVLRSQIALTTHSFLVAEKEGHIVGTALVQRMDTDMAMLHRLYVRPAYQRQSIGRALLAGVLQRVPASARVCLEVDRANAAAIAFYEAHGFAVRDERPEGATLNYERTPTNVGMASLQQKRRER